jgi:ABC-type sugar transport system permease subunit
MNESEVLGTKPYVDRLFSPGGIAIHFHFCISFSQNHLFKLLQGSRFSRNRTDLSRLQTIQRTAKYPFVHSILEKHISDLVFLFSMLLSSGIRGKKFFRAMIYLPNLVPAVAIVAMWTQYIYHPRFGFWKTFFTKLGLEDMANINWNSLDLVFWGMLIAYVWGGVGWTLIIILAGIERIPITLYEVARLDGASAFRQFRHITLPLLRDVLRVTFVFWSIGIINLFTFPKLWTPVVTVEGTYTPAIYLFQISFGARQEASGVNTLDVGKGAAIAVMLLAAVIIVSFAINKIFKQDELEY